MAEHLISRSTYLIIVAILVVLTLATVGISFLHIGETWHTIVGLGIAALKASLVALFFMHVLTSSRLIWIMAGAGLFWLGILFVLTLSDYLTRPWLMY